LDDFLLQLGPVGVGVRVVGRLNSQLAHALQDSVSLVQRTFSRLDERDAVLRVAGRLAQTADLTAHLLRDSKTRRVVAGTVNAETRRELLDGLRDAALVDDQLTMGV